MKTNFKILLFFSVTSLFTIYGIVIFEPSNISVNQSAEIPKKLERIFFDTLGLANEDFKKEIEDQKINEQHKILILELKKSAIEHEKKQEYNKAILNYVSIMSMQKNDIESIDNIIRILEKQGNIDEQRKWESIRQKTIDDLNK